MLPGSRPPSFPLAPRLRLKSQAFDVVLAWTSNSGRLIDSQAAALGGGQRPAKMEPTPNLRVGLYSYGNNVRRKGCAAVELTTDLTRCTAAAWPRPAAMSSRASRASSRRMVEDKNARAYPVCGNEAADQDKVVSLGGCSLAKKGVVINTICGAANMLSRGRSAFATRCWQVREHRQDRARDRDQDSVRRRDRARVRSKFIAGTGPRAEARDDQLAARRQPSARPGVAADRAGKASRL